MNGITMRILPPEALVVNTVYDGPVYDRRPILRLHIRAEGQCVEALYCGGVASHPSPPRPGDVGLLAECAACLERYERNSRESRKAALPLLQWLAERAQAREQEDAAR